MVTASLLPVILGFRHLGTNLSPWPQPHGTNELITHGIYRRLRHPLYLSLILLAAGWARIAAKLAGTPCHGHFGSHPAWQGSPRGTAPRPEACPLCWLRPHNRALFASLARPEPAGGVPCSVRASSGFGFASRSPYGQFLLRASSIFPLSPPIGFTRRPWCWEVLWPASLRRAVEPWPSRCSASSSRWSDFSLSLVVLNIGQLVYFNLQNPSWEKITASTIFSVILMAAFAVTLDRLALARDKRAS